MPDITLLVEAAPAGGAATGQVIAMTVALTIGFGGLILLGESHRRGVRTPLGTLAAFSSRVGGLPQWVALPLAIVGISLVGALFGYMWDVSLHIDKGRDPGPFANPSHFFILAGLYGIVAGGYLSSVLVKPGERPGRDAIRISPNFQVPLGGALIVAAGLFALAGFPLDDLWHRLFGQDVTLWGPTHLIMLSGGLLTLVGVVILFEDGVSIAGKRRERGVELAGSNGHSNGKPAGIADRIAAVRQMRGAPPKELLGRLADVIPSIPLWPTRALIAGGFLAGLSIYQGEFDYGVPQFELVLQPLMIAGSAGLALVAARVWLGKGGALGAVAWYLLIRGAVWLIVGPILGRTHPAMPLYIPEALVIEAVALTALSRRPLILGPVAGLAAGAIGFFAEWPWINAVFPIHWSSNLLPEGLVIAAVAGTAAGTIGALFGLALRRELPERPRLAPALAAGSLVVVMGCFAFGLADNTPKNVTAQVTLADTKTGPDREVMATVRLNPPDIADGASWVREIAWQGGGLIGAPMERIGPGVYRTTEPLPVHDDWKSAIRIQNGHTLLGVPIFAAPDSAIPDPGVAAPASFTRPLENDRKLLQRERKDDVPGWAWLAAELSVLVMGLVFLTLLAFGISRYARGPRRDEPEDLMKTPTYPKGEPTRWPATT
jgi:hypothetical protein